MSVTLFCLLMPCLIYLHYPCSGKIHYMVTRESNWRQEKQIFLNVIVKFVLKPFLGINVLEGINFTAVNF